MEHLKKKKSFNKEKNHPAPLSLFLTPLSTYSQVKRGLEINHIPESQVLVVTKPLGPLKFSRVLHALFDPNISPKMSRQIISPVVEKSPSFTLTSTIDDTSENHLQVLVVEDNSVNQMVMKNQLEKLKVSFSIVPTGNGAIEIWQRQVRPIPLIFMDVEIEGPLNGLQTTMEIRKLEEAQNIPKNEKSFIIVMTGRAMEEDKNEAFSCGCDDYQIKPVSLAIIAECIKKRIQNVSK